MSGVFLSLRQFWRRGQPETQPKLAPFGGPKGAELARNGGHPLSLRVRSADAGPQAAPAPATGSRHSSSAGPGPPKGVSLVGF